MSLCTTNKLHIRILGTTSNLPNFSFRKIHMYIFRAIVSKKLPTLSQTGHDKLHICFPKGQISYMSNKLPTFIQMVHDKLRICLCKELISYLTNKLHNQIPSAVSNKLLMSFLRGKFYERSATSNLRWISCLFAVSKGLCVKLDKLCWSCWNFCIS